MTAALRTPGPGTSRDSPSWSLHTCPRWSSISPRISTKDILENSSKCYQIKVVEHKGPLSRMLGIWAIWVSSAQRTVLHGHGGVHWGLGWLVSFWLQPIENLAQSVCQTEKVLTENGWLKSPHQIQSGIRIVHADLDSYNCLAPTLPGPLIFLIYFHSGNNFDSPVVIVSLWLVHFKSWP